MHQMNMCWMQGNMHLGPLALLSIYWLIFDTYNYCKVVPCIFQTNNILDL